MVPFLNSTLDLYLMLEAYAIHLAVNSPVAHDPDMDVITYWCRSERAVIVRDDVAGKESQPLAGR